MIWNVPLVQSRHGAELHGAHFVPAPRPAPAAPTHAATRGTSSGAHEPPAFVAAAAHPNVATGHGAALEREPKLLENASSGAPRHLKKRDEIMEIRPHTAVATPIPAEVLVEPEVTEVEEPQEAPQEVFWQSKRLEEKVFFICFHMFFHCFH